MKNDHILDLLPDYVLGLLDDRQKKQIDRHIVACQRCRTALVQEREVGRLVRQTLAAVPRPAPARLARLKPAAPRPRQRPALWQKQMVTIAVMLVILLSSIGLTAYGDTATLTHSATAFWPAATPATGEPLLTGTVTAVRTAELSPPGSSPIIHVAGPPPALQPAITPAPVAQEINQ